MANRFRLLLLYLFLLSGCAGLKTSNTSGLQKIVIVHSNDIHGRAWPFLREDGRWMGGYAAQAKMVSQLREDSKKEGSAFFLMSAGDVNTGVPESDFTEAKPDFEAMNLIGYDAMVIGNHDLDQGLALLSKQINWARFPLLASNLKIKNSPHKPWTDSIVIEKSGIRLGIIGVTTDQLLNLILTEHAKKLSVENPIAATQREIKRLRNQGADIILVLSHLGVAQSGLGLHQYVRNDDRKLAHSLSEIDVIVGGHSHTFLDSGIFEGETLIVQAGYRGDFLGKIELLWDQSEKKIRSKKAVLIEIDPQNGVDEKVKKTVEAYRKAYEHELSEPIFEADEMIIGQRNRSEGLELPLGNLVCDALRTEMKTDLAFFNSGGIRSNLPKGIVKRRDILEAFPFRNTIATGFLTGKEVSQLLNDGVNRGKVGGGVLQVSGLRYEIKGNKVSAVWVGERPIEPEKLFSFSTNSYVISAGDKLKTMRRAKKVSLRSETVDQVLEKYLSTGPLKAHGNQGNRILLK